MNPRPALRRLARMACLMLLCVSLASCFSAPPQIISIQPNQGSTGVAADQAVTVTFDQPILHRSVVGRFSLSPALPGCNPTRAFGAPPAAICSITWVSGRQAFTFSHPGAIFAPDTTYTFTLEAGVRSASGVVNDINHTWQLRSQTAPQVSSFDPGSGTVASDAGFAVIFDRDMNPVTTAAAIHLNPAVAGTEVMENTLSQQRFVVLPGRLLTPGVSYTVTIGTGATDYAGQHLAVPQSASFVAGELSSTGHAVILAGSPGAAASSVILTALTPAAPGEPAPSELLLRAVPGSVVSYRAATLSPDGTELAVVESVTGAAPTLRIVDAATGLDLADYPGGAMPSWSATGELAFSQGESVVVRSASGITSTLPAGAPLTAPAVWSHDGATLALPVTAADGAPQVDLATPSVSARYSLPGLTSATDPSFSANDAELVMERPASATRPAAVVLVDIAGGTAPSLLAAGLYPMGFAADGSIIAYSDANASIISLTPGGGSTTLPATIDANEISSAVLTPDGRQIAYLSSDPLGVVQAWVETVAGSNPVALTALPPNGLVAEAISLGA